MCQDEERKWEAQPAAYTACSPLSQDQDLCDHRPRGMERKRKRNKSPDRIGLDRISVGGVTGIDGPISYTDLLSKHDHESSIKGNSDNLRHGLATDDVNMKDVSAAASKTEF